MKSKTLLALVVLLAACMAFLLIRNSGPFNRPSPTPPPSGGAPVFAAAPTGIVKVAVAADSGTRLVLAKQGDEWRIEEPFAAKADTYKVNSLIDAIRDLKSSRSFSPDDKDAVKPQITSVDKPLWTVDLTGAGGQSWRLAVGKPLPLRQGETYVQPGGQKKTFVAMADLAGTLQRPAGDYRDKTVIRFNASQAVELSIAGREVREGYDIVKQKDEWGIVKPFSARADQDAVKDILGNISYLTAASFVSDEPTGLAGYGLENGKERLVVRVSVQPEAGTPAAAPASASMPTSASAPASAPAPKVYAIALGERTTEKGGDRVYARILGEPAVFQVNASVLDNILKKMEAVRRSNVLEFDTESVSAIDLSVPDGNLALSKQDGSWMMKRPITGKANQRAVADLLAKLAALKAQAWVEPRAAAPATTGLDKPYASITLNLAGKGETTGLLVGSSVPPDQTYVKSPSGTSVALVKTADTIPFLASGATYWDPAIYELPYDITPSRIVLWRRDNAYTLERDSGGWKMTSPIQTAADETHVDQIVRDLDRVAADKIVYLGYEVPEKYTKAAYNLTVDLYGRRPPTTQPASATAPASAPTSSPSSTTGPVAFKWGFTPDSNGNPPLYPHIQLPPSQPASAASQATTQAATKPALGPETLVVKLQVAKIEGKAYAWLPAGAGAASGTTSGPTSAAASAPSLKPIAVGEFPVSLYEDLAAELRDRTVWHFEPNEVLALKLVSGDRRLELRREGDEWVNALNPDEKADAEKVRAYLGDLKDLSADRYETYHKGPAEIQKFDLAQPWASLELRLAGGKTLSLAVAKRGQDTTATNRYGSASTVDGVFLLPSDLVGKLAKSFDDFKKSAARPAPEGLQ